LVGRGGGKAAGGGSGRGRVGADVAGGRSGHAGAGAANSFGQRGARRARSGLELGERGRLSGRSSRACTRSWVLKICWFLFLIFCVVNLVCECEIEHVVLWIFCANEIKLVLRKSCMNWFVWVREILLIVMNLYDLCMIFYMCKLSSC
jgi:hypothetical protein